MKLFHFCREKDMRGIRSQGITKGMIPSFRPVGGKKLSMLLYDGWQWLTLDGDHDKQSWATCVLFKEDRTEYRLTVEIPEKETDSVYDREKLLTVYPEVAPLFDGWPGSEKWRVFRGPIPKYWIKGIEHYENGEWHPMPWR